MASGGLPGYLAYRFSRGKFWKVFKYSRAFWSVTKLLSPSRGEPISQKITASQSLTEKGKPCLCSVGFLAGLRGKQDLPGNRGVLYEKLGAFSFIIPISSANIQPTAHMSIPGPQSFSSKMISGALYHLVYTCPVSSLFMLRLASLVLTNLAVISFFVSSFYCSISC